jgi:hypothetical protein
VSNVCNCVGSAVRGNVPTFATMASGWTGSVSTDPDKLTFANARDGHVNYKNLKKDQLKELCATFLDHIEDLKLRLEKAKCPANTSTPNQTFELRAELKELKDSVFVNENGINAMGDKPASLRQAYWATGDRRAIPWVVINRLAEDDPCKTSSEEDDVKGAVSATPSAVNATSVEEDKSRATSIKVKLARLAKLVKMAKSMDLWCLLPYVPLSQEAKDKQRKVCPVNLRGRSARPTSAAASIPRSALWPTTARGRSPRPRAHCGTCRSRLRASPRPRETSMGGGAAPSLPLCSKGNNSNNARPAKLDQYLVKLEAEYHAEELKARIRAKKMNLVNDRQSCRPNIRPNNGLPNIP